jgi:hypothetical protein
MVMQVRAAANTSWETLIHISQDIPDCWEDAAEESFADRICEPTVEIPGGGAKPVSAKPGAEQSTLIDMKIDGIVTVKIVGHYPEKDLFLVADNTVYGLRVRFSGTEAKTCFKVGEVITAIFVEAKFKSSPENEIEFLELENAQVVNSSLCALSRPVALLVRRETQV